MADGRSQEIFRARWACSGLGDVDIKFLLILPTSRNLIDILSRIGSVRGRLQICRIHILSLSLSISTEEISLIVSSHELSMWSLRPISPDSCHFLLTHNLCWDLFNGVLFGELFYYTYIGSQVLILLSTASLAAIKKQVVLDFLFSYTSYSLLDCFRL